MIKQCVCITDMWRQIFLSKVYKVYAAINLLTAKCKAMVLHQGTTQTAQPFVLSERLRKSLLNHFLTKNEMVFYKETLDL